MFNHRITLQAIVIIFSLVSNVSFANNSIQVIDAFGQLVTVPANAKRIICLSEIDFDSALALNVKPIATIKGRGQNAIPRYLQDKGQEIAIVGAIGRPDIERILEFQPDLIITSQQRPGTMNQLSMIAPTVVTSKRGEDWKTVFQRTAQVLNKKEEAKSFLKKYQQRLVEVRNNIKVKDATTISIVRWNPKGPAYMLNDAFASLIVRDLKLQRPTIQRKKGAHHSRPLSLEALQQIDGDWIFFGSLDSSGKAVEAMNEVKNSAAFKQLRASKLKHITLVDGSLWTSVGGPLAAYQVLADIERVMKKAG